MPKVVIMMPLLRRLKTEVLYVWNFVHCVCVKNESVAVTMLEDCAHTVDKISHV
jgi:hypothetical protein